MPVPRPMEERIPSPTHQVTYLTHSCTWRERQGWNNYGLDPTRLCKKNACLSMLDDSLTHIKGVMDWFPMPISCGNADNGRITCVRSANCLLGYAPLKADRRAND